jgi:hypothetical protein
MATTALLEGVIPMTWLARPKPIAVVAAALILTTAVNAEQGRQQPAPEGASDQAKSIPGPAAAQLDLPANRAIAREQLALIDKAWTMQRELARGSRVELNDASFAMWGRRRLETLRRAGASKAEIIGALEKYLNDLKEDEVEARSQLEHSRTTALSVYDVQFRVMEAEIWLNEEKAR